MNIFRGCSKKLILSHMHQPRMDYVLRISLILFLILRMFSLLFLCVVKEKEKVRYEADCAVNNQTSWAGNTLGWLHVCVDVWGPDSDSPLPVSRWPCLVVPRTCWFVILSNSRTTSPTNMPLFLPLLDNRRYFAAHLSKHEFETIAVFTLITSYKRKMLVKRIWVLLCESPVAWHGVEFTHDVVSCLCFNKFRSVPEKMQFMFSTADPLDPPSCCSVFVIRGCCSNFCPHSKLWRQWFVKEL